MGAFSEVLAELDGIDMDQPESVPAMSRIIAVLEAAEPPKSERGVAVLDLLRKTARRLHEDLILIHRGNG